MRFENIIQFVVEYHLINIITFLFGFLKGLKPIMNTKMDFMNLTKDTCNSHQSLKKLLFCLKRKNKTIKKKEATIRFLHLDHNVILII